MKKHQGSFLALAQRKELKCEKFLKTMKQIIPWESFLEIIKPYYTEKERGRNKTELILLLKIYFLQQWYNLSDPGAEEAIYDRNSFQKFLGIDLLADKIPDETTILNFRHLLEENEIQAKLFERANEILEAKGYLMKTGTIMDATIIAAPSSTKNLEGKRDPEMSSTRKNNNFHFGMKMHIGVDSQSGLVHTVEGSTAKEADNQYFENLLHGTEKLIGGDKGYYNEKIKKRCRKEGIYCAILDKNKANHLLSTKQKARNQRLSSIRAKVEHPFQVIKTIWKHIKTRYRGIEKNTKQWITLFMLSNFYKLRYKLAAQAA